MPGENSQQSWNPERYERNAGFVADLGAEVMDLLAPKAGERILDLGCGHGKLTERIANTGAALVAVDASPEQVEGACKRGLDARIMDARELTFEKEFDAVFSNAALHWIKDPEPMIRGVHAALKPGGRFVAECGGHGCVETIHRALMDALDRRGYDGRAASPWYFPTTEDYRARLQRAGFEIRYIALIDRPTPLPGDLLGWLATFSESFTRVLPETERQVFLEEVQRETRDRLCNAEGLWTADYVRLRFEAHKPS